MENYDIIVLSRRNDNCQHIKPTKVTIREFGSIVCVEYPIKLGDPKNYVWTPTCDYAGFIA